MGGKRGPQTQDRAGITGTLTPHPCHHPAPGRQWLPAPAPAEPWKQPAALWKDQLSPFALPAGSLHSATCPLPSLAMCVALHWALGPSVRPLWGQTRGRSQAMMRDDQGRGRGDKKCPNCGEILKEELIGCATGQMWGAVEDTSGSLVSTSQGYEKPCKQQVGGPCLGLSHLGGPQEKQTEHPTRVTLQREGDCGMRWVGTWPGKGE